MEYLVHAFSLFSLISAHAGKPVSFSVNDFKEVDTSTQRNNISCNSFTSRIAMIENFFTLVYNEFEFSPPVCVCVQMCKSQPLFCYPNGCLRRDPTYSGNNIRLKFDVATFPPTPHVTDKVYKIKYDSNYDSKLDNKFNMKFDSKVDSKLNEKLDKVDAKLGNKFDYKLDAKHLDASDANNHKNVIIKPVGTDQLLPVNLQYFDKKFKSLLKFPLPTTRLMDTPRKERYTFIRSDAAGKYLTEEEYQAAEDQFKRHLQVSE